MKNKQGCLGLGEAGHMELVFNLHSCRFNMAQYLSDMGGASY